MVLEILGENDGLQYKVYPTTNIAVLSTGDGLVEPSTGHLSRGQIRDSNRAMLLAAAVQHHCKVVDLGIAKDDEEYQGRILDKAFASGINILITSGGVSMGDKDFIRPLLENCRNSKIFKILSNALVSVIKPGKPFTFAEIGSQSTESKILAFGLPGNPVSSSVCFHLFVVPAIRQLAGWTNPHHLRGLIAMPIFDRVSLMNVPYVLPMNFSFAESTGHQRSSRLLSMKSANALLEFPATGSVVSAGTPLAAIIISNLRPMDFGKNHISSDSTFTLPGIKSDKTTTDSSGGADLRVAIYTYTFICN
ncbi:molybdopterin biosynthesis protein CNX1-like [Trifolium pratense]|uniref:molybdopterin biosynthesis protein CNX1-like n=1 Tax=Trifolium pratense TaxID=57577 RepID=UPI001E6925C8|nr:molybdopterin biosynthesis protein CNX1-like [Trifolium pratense]